MNATFPPVKRLVVLLPLLLAAITTVGAQQPDPAAILKGARMTAALVNLPEGLTGTVTKGRTKVPVTLHMRGKDIQFVLQDKDERFHLRLGDSELDLFEITADGKTARFPADKLTQSIRDTDVTYEDISLRFLYWPDAKLEGEEKVGMFDCYKIKVDKPKPVASRYAAVYVWVSKKHGAFVKVQGYDAKGGLVKEFQVQDVMPLDNNTWGLRKMQVATHDPATGRRSSLSQVTFDKPASRKNPGPAGLR